MLDLKRLQSRKRVTIVVIAMTVLVGLVLFDFWKPFASSVSAPPGTSFNAAKEAGADISPSENDPADAPKQLMR